MPRRCFAFGCSFTKWFYPTWADYIGINYDEYYNFANGGINNELIGMRFIEVNNKFNFTTDDIVVVGITGLSRVHLFVDYENEHGDDNRGIWAAGDPVHDVAEIYIKSISKWNNFSNIISFMRDFYWKKRLGIYPSWIHLTNIKKYLVEKNIPHKIIMSLDNRNYLQNIGDLDVNVKEKKMVEDIYNIVDVTISLEEFNDIHKTSRYKDTHPFTDVHLKFVLEYFPELISLKSINVYNEVLKMIANINDTKEAFSVLSSYTTEKFNHNNTFRMLYGTYV